MGEAMPNLPWTHRTVVQLSILATCHGAQIVNTHHFEASSVMEATFLNDELVQNEVNDLVNHWLTTAKNPYLNGHGAEFVVNRVVGQCVERPGNFRHRLTPIETTPTGQTNGDGTLGAIEVTTTSAIIRWRTPIAGKSHRGRTYYGPLAANQVSDGRLSSSGTTNITLYTTALMGLWGPTGTQSSDFRLTVYSRPYNSGEYQYTTRRTGSLTVVTPPDYAGNSTNITSYSIDPTLRVQRRRELGVGS